MVNASRSGSGTALNIGIGVLIGLIVAFLVATVAMRLDGPFNDNANTNVLTPTGNTDPNSPLYSAPQNS